ncbi:DUF6158 family protein [Kitasatospora atroaurantiaca]|uniref:Uncharacterized protein n=1 Tax=Kitasatospora atroaurantiaca TaxID=285545 RepID=A0A561EL07_9ACTN|nr:DUF6158 family protein [Kitasatospora atroaurantiaca]TWE16294.1 hypothetical protein FB465_1272 [Kitasatospora atroaurantiaca]
MPHPDTLQDRSAGVPPPALDTDVLVRELEQLHRTRHETFLWGSDDALQRHTLRMGQLEAEYLRRYPYRQVSAGRTRAGARARDAAARAESKPE